MSYRIRLAAFDMDNTLLKNDKSISPYTMEVLRDLKARGVVLVPASGRVLPRLMQYPELMECCPYVIAANGTQVRETASGKLLMGWTMNAEDAVEAVHHLREKAVNLRGFSGDSAVQEVITPEAMDFVIHFYDYLRFDIPIVLDLASHMKKAFDQKEELWKIVAFYNDRDRFHEVMAEPFPVRNLTFTQTDDMLCEVTAGDATKGNALRWLQQYLGISRDETAAFGDNWNDMPMLEAAGISVAVSNAIPEIRSAALHVCGSNEEDGPAHFLARSIS